MLLATCEGREHPGGSFRTFAHLHFGLMRLKRDRMIQIQNVARTVGSRTSPLCDGNRRVVQVGANVRSAVGLKEERVRATRMVEPKRDRPAGKKILTVDTLPRMLVNTLRTLSASAPSDQDAVGATKEVRYSGRAYPRTTTLWFDPHREPIGQGALSPPPSLPRNADAMVYISKYRLSFIEASAAFNVNPDLLGAVALASGGRLNQESDAQTAQIRVKGKNAGLINASDMFTITQGGWRVGRMQLQISDVYAAIRKGNLNLPPLIAHRMPHRLEWFDTLTARQQYQLCAAIATDDQAAIYAAASYLRLNAVRMVRSGGDSELLNVNSEAHFDQLADAYADGPPRAPLSAYRRASQDTGLYAKIAVLSRGVVRQLLGGAEPKPLFFRGYHPVRHAP
jgi:hypothetical protein